MAPLGNAVIFAALALLGVIPFLILRKRVPSTFAVGIFAFLGVFTVLLPFGELARWAAALLAMGMAVQLARQWRRAPGRWTRRTVGATAALAAVSITLGVGQRGILALRRAAALRSLPAADAANPNILLIILDTVRGEDLSLYGYSRPTTPTLERWAARGVVFDYAIATAPWTLPSHGSLFTGELGNRLGGGWLKPVSSSAPTLAEVLRSRGYLTGGFAANLLYTSYESGLTRGFIDYQDYPLSLTQIFLQVPLLQTGLFQSVVHARERWEIRQAIQKLDLKVSRLPADEYVPASRITDTFLTWQARIHERPFFAFLNYFDAHGPYRSPPEFQSRFASGGSGRDRYDAAIAYLDAELDRLFTALEQRGALRKTLVVVTSDHGEFFGEHKLQDHANALYLPVLRVPLLLFGPSRVPAGVRVADPVSLRDVPATILELVTGGPSPELPGSSLARSWDPAPSRTGERPSPVVSEVIRGRYRNNPNFLNTDTWLESVLDERYHYIRSGLGKEELYAWRTDSLELFNLADSKEGSALLPGFRAQLERQTGSVSGGPAGSARAPTRKRK